MDSYEILKTIYPEDKLEHVEEFVILLLNRANKVLGWAMISIGGVSGCVVDAKVVYQLALNCNASSLILSHNHPSGNLQPSDADVKITKKLKEAGQLLDINVLDHIVITSEGFYSFADEGMI